MGTQSQNILKALPSFIKGLILLLSKWGDLVFQVCRLARREELGKKGQLILTWYGPRGNEWSHARASSHNEKWNRQTRMESVETLFSFNLFHTSKKTQRWRLGSSFGAPPNCNCWTMEMSTGLSSKLWDSTVGRAILEVMPLTPGVTKFRNVLLWSSLVFVPKMC